MRRAVMKYLPAVHPRTHSLRVSSSNDVAHTWPALANSTRLSLPRHLKGAIHVPAVGQRSLSRISALLPSLVTTQPTTIRTFCSSTALRQQPVNSYTPGGPPVPGSFDPRDSRFNLLPQLAAANIGYPTELGWIKVKSPGVGAVPVSVALSRRHCFHYSHGRYLNQEGHPLGYMILGRYLERVERDEPLWWHSYGKIDGSIVYVRRTAERRARKAFRTALLQRGYDEFGRRLSPEQQQQLQQQQQQQQQQKAGLDGGKEVVAATGSEGERIGQAEGAVAKDREPFPTARAGDSAVMRLHGTVRLQINDNKKFLMLPFEQLVNFMSSVLDALEKELGQDERGRPLHIRRRTPTSSSGKGRPRR